MLRCLFITALLSLPLHAAAHDPVLLPPAPSGVNPCDLPRVRCPLALQDVHEHLVEARVAGDRRDLDHWQRRLRTWHAFNPDYRWHRHPHD